MPFFFLVQNLKRIKTLSTFILEFSINKIKKKNQINDSKNTYILFLNIGSIRPTTKTIQLCFGTLRNT